MEDTDITGKTFNRLTVLGKSDRVGAHGEVYWKCRCSCPEHNIRDVTKYSLVHGVIPSCGCLRKEKLAALRRKDLTGQKFGRLIAICPVGQDKRGHIVWKCRCENDGNYVNVSTSNLHGGSVRSCGCLASELRKASRKWADDDERLLAKKLDNMKQRCYNQHNASYHRYGKRGITVCDE